MAALPRLRMRISDSIPTSSMADIAFLLLIFFLVTTVFDEERGLSVVLPEHDLTVEVPPSNVLHLLVQPDGRVEVRRGESVNGQIVAAGEVAALWRTEVARNENLIAGVKTDPEASYRRMIAVLDALQQAGAERISLQSLER